MAARRQSAVRGALVLLAAALALWVTGLPFAVPSPQARVAEVGVSTYGLTASGALPGLSRSQGMLSGAPPAGGRLPSAAGEAAGKAADTTADGISLALASAGAAVAMRAAATALRAGGEAEPAAKGESAFEKYKVAVFILLWYVFNIGYNIYNKKALIAYPYPWAIALWQMAFGFAIFVPLWALGIRKTPKLTIQQAITLSPAAFFHLATHLGAVVAFFAGAVSFGHIVKASEPVVSSILNFAFMGEVLSWQVYAALLPIIFGVGLASASELSFNWLCFGAAMGSNFGSAARAVYSKKVMGGGDIGENMDSANTYAVLTIMATVMLIPISLAIEGPSAMLNGFQAAKAAGGVPFLMAMLYSGFTYYMYNEVAFLALGRLDPVSHAVCNAMKRVVIIIAAVFVFKTPVTGLGVAGSSIAIAGTLLYSLAKNKFPSKK